MSEANDVVILNGNDSKNTAMNAKLLDPNQSQKLTESLHSSLSSSVRKHTDKVTGTIDYASMNDSEEFREFKKLTSELVFCDLLSMNKEEKMCLFMNVYNILTIHAITYCTIINEGPEPISSVLQIPDFWKKFCYKIGGHLFSLDDIEHGILRGNRQHPTSHVAKLCDGDPRIRFIITPVDARIHFTLNCGAKSCPRIEVYSPENLNDKLDMATRAYLSQEILLKRNEGNKVKIQVPQIFEWYEIDFASNLEGVLRWILSYVDGSIFQAIEEILSHDSSFGRVEYGYDWSLS